MTQVVARGAGGSIARRLAVVATEGDDLLTQPCVRCEDAVVAVAVDAGWRDEAAEGAEKLEGRESRERALRARGYTVISAENGERAVQIATEHAGVIHLLLSDMVMPVLGGRDAARRIREHRPDIRVLFMSGYSEQDVLNPGSLDAAMGFIAKPFTPLELENAVRTVLDGTATPENRVSETV